MLRVLYSIGFGAPLAKQVKLADLANNTDSKRASGLNEARRKNTS